MPSFFFTLLIEDIRSVEQRFFSRIFFQYEGSYSPFSKAIISDFVAEKASPVSVILWAILSAFWYAFVS